MNPLLIKIIRNMLLEADDVGLNNPGVQKVNRQNPKITSQTVAPQSSGRNSYTSKTFGKSSRTRTADAVVINIVIDDYDDIADAIKAAERNESLPNVLDVQNENPWSAYGGLPEYVNKKPGWTNSQTISNKGWVVFGVSLYSPIDDLSSFVTTDLRKAVANYKAYGHAYVLFIDDEGNSVRYEFGPSKSCSDVDTGEQFEKIKNSIIKDDRLVQKIYNAILMNPVMIKNSPILAAGANMLPLSARKTVVSGLLGTFLNDLPLNILPDLIHLLVPGTVWGPKSAPQPEFPPTTPVTRFVTPRSIVKALLFSRERGLENLLFSETNGYIVTQYREDRSYIKLGDPSSDFHLDRIYNIKIKNMILDLESIMLQDERTQAIAGVRSNNLKPGVDYCQKILGMKCQVPYAVPFPGFDFPKMSGALNCGTFAANAFNLASPSKKITLSTGTHELLSPASIFSQIESSADFALGSPSM